MPGPLGIFFLVYYCLDVVLVAPASLVLSLAGVSLELVVSSAGLAAGCFAGVIVEPVWAFLA